MSKTWKLTEGATWRKKLEGENPNHGKVCKIPAKMKKRLGVGTKLIPKPLDVDALMRNVRKGKLVSVSQLREQLARKGKASGLVRPGRTLHSSLTTKALRHKGEVLWRIVIVLDPGSRTD